MERFIGLIVLLVVLSCSKDDKGCECTLKVTEDGTSFYYVEGVPTDCEGGFDRPSNVPQNHFMVDLLDCK
jgi:hypothetical protein